jgi:hypothetical protein
MPLVRKKLLNSKFHETMKSNLLKAAIVALLVVISMPIYAQTENIYVYRNGSVIFTQAVSQIDSVTFRTPDADGNMGVLNQFLKSNNYFSEIGCNFNTDERGDDLIFSFKDNSRLRGFGIVQNGIVYTTSITIEHNMYPTPSTNNSTTVVWNGDYIVFAINGGDGGIAGLFGYTMQGRDFSTVKQIWENRSNDLRYVWADQFSEVINNTYYTAIRRVNIYLSSGRVNMQTGDVIFSDCASEAKIFLLTAKVNDLYYGILIKDNYATWQMASTSRYYNIFDDYTVIRSDLTSETLRWSTFSYTKRRAALIDFTNHIARPIYLNGETDMEVPATLTTIPYIEYKGKYYVIKENANYTQLNEVIVPYDLFDNKYIEVK